MELLQQQPLLQPDQERQLWFSYKEKGCENSRIQILLAYQPLVRREASQIRAPGDVRGDLIQEGSIGLIEALESFDPQRNTSFSTFARYRIRGRMLNFLQKHYPHRTAMWEESMGEVEEGSLEQKVERRLLYQEVYRSMQRLPGQERQVLIKRFLEDCTAQETAKALSISSSYIYRLQKRAIRRLRGMLRSLIREIKRL